MKKKKNKLINFLKLGILLFGASILLWNCEKEELTPIEEQQSLLQERTSNSISFEALENTPVYKHFNQKLQLNLKTDKHLRHFEKGTENNSNDITIITQKVNQVINNGVETFSMFIKYKEQQENTYYNLVLYKKENLYRIYTLKIETSKKLHSKGTSAGMETDVTVQAGIIPYDGWDDIGDDSSTGGDGYEWQCWTVTLQIAYPCGSGGHYPSGSGLYPQGCTGSPTAPYWPGYNYISDTNCGYVWVGNGNLGDNNNDSGNTGNGGNNSSDTNDSVDVETVNPSDVIPDGADPEEWFDDQIFIDDNFKNEPCLKAVYDKMGKASKFKEYLQNFEPDGSLADLRFTTDNNFGNNNQKYVNAMAITKPPLTSNEISIVFNTDTNTSGNIKNKPDVFKAVAMIHEIIHADMYRKMLDAVKESEINQTTLDWRTWPNGTDFDDFLESLQNKYYAIFDAYTNFEWNTSTPTSAQHQLMAARYRNVVKQALTDYDSTLTDTQKEALSWLGLNKANIKAWQYYPNKSSVTSTLTNIKNTYPNGCN
mgnify:CR=1 FL=1